MPSDLISFDTNGHLTPAALTYVLSEFLLLVLDGTIVPSAIELPVEGGAEQLAVRFTGPQWLSLDVRIERDEAMGYLRYFLQEDRKRAQQAV